MRSLISVVGFTCLMLATVIEPSLTMEESPSSSPLQLQSSGNLDIESEVDPDGILQGIELGGNPAKRAYTYVSEYKRLPLYNFGLGKRWGSGSSGGSSSNNVDEDKRARLYSFGLGKRARPYNFGLGKRGGGGAGSDSLGPPSYIVRGPVAGDGDYDDLSARGSSGLSSSSLSEPIEDYFEKRSRLYSIGLGKRMSGDDFNVQRFNFGLGKRPSEDFGHRYKFGLGKRRLIVDDDDDIQQQPVAS